VAMIDAAQGTIADKDICLSASGQPLRLLTLFCR
jgi:hypothetical protein